MSRAADAPSLLATCSRLEKAVLAHVAAMLLFAGWAYGGNIWWARDALAAWGLGGGVALTVLALRSPGDLGHESRCHAWVLLPWTLFGALVLVSCLNPSFVERTMDGQTVLLHLGAAHPWLPSTVSPAASLREWAFVAGAWLAACNLWLVVRSRRALRWLLAGAAASAFVLAVFGTMQKLLVPSTKVAAGQFNGYFTGFYFGAALSPQERFFATFIYNNHWGAFLLLWLAVAAGLLFYLASRPHRGRSLWHSPFTALLAAGLFMAAGAPMSASRSATAMTGLLVLVATGHALRQIAAFRRAQGRPATPAVAIVLAVLLAAVAAVGWLARSLIDERVRETRAALASDHGLFQDRLDLYRDTWGLARQQPVFGWGLESFGTAFQLVRPRPVAANRQYEKSYVEAHSDWLQSVAETGFVGTALLGLMGALPLAWLPRRAFRQPVVAYPLVGCALLALYAWIELPFANGAVMVSFWVVYFVALRYATLQQRAESGSDD